MIHSLRAFHHRNFRLYILGQSLGVVGYWVQQIAMSWLVYRLTGSAWLLGVTAFAGQIAVLVLAPFGGLWADRVPRRKLLLITQGAASIPAFTLATLAHLDIVAVWHIIVMASALGIVMAIDAPIRQSFLPEMVPARQDLPSAVAFNSGMYNTARKIGPTIAGVMLAVSSEAFCFLVNGVTKLLTNSLVIVVPVDSDAKVSGGADLANFRRIAIGDPVAVPAGVYAKSWLTKQNLWENIGPKCVGSENVRAALAALESGNADAAIVYKTDAAISKKVKVAWTVPAGEAPAITYPVAVCTATKQADEAKKFADFLKSEEASKIFTARGFGLAEK